MKKPGKSLRRPAGLCFALSFLALVSCAIPTNSLSSSSDALSSSTPSASSADGVSSSSAALSSSSTAISSGSVSSSSSSDAISSSSSFLQGAEGFEIYALEQKGNYGDCTLFKKGDYEILIDGGNSESAPQLVSALKDHVGDHVLDLLILTHPHADHYGGFTYSKTAANAGGSLIDGGITSVKQIVDCGADSYSYSAYADYYVKGFRKYWIAQGTQYHAVASLVSSNPYGAITLVDSSLQIQWLDTGNYVPAGGAASGDANDNSLACDIRFGTYDFFMAGDLPSGPEQDLVDRYRSHSFLKAGNHLIYKACHHGSNGANSSALLSFLKPEVAWASAGISDGNGTSAGIQSAQHPFKGARSRIESVTGREKMWWNGTAGTLAMSIPADSSSFSIDGLGREYGDYYVGGKLVERTLEKAPPLELTAWAQASF